MHTTTQAKKQYQFGAVTKDGTTYASPWLDTLEAGEAWFRALCAEYMPNTWKRHGKATRGDA